MTTSRLAAALGADGVHLGRDDGDIAAARARLPHALIGASCYDDLVRAQRGRFRRRHACFRFGVCLRHQASRGTCTLETLRTARERWPALRIVAIGGITAANIGTVAAAGAHAAAVIGSVFDSGDPAHAVLDLQRVFTLGLNDLDSHHDQSATV